MGQNVPNCVRSDLIDVTWTYDPLPEKAAQAAAACGPHVKTATELETILAAEDVDMCICAVPHSVHEQVVSACAPGGEACLHGKSRWR